MAPFRFGHQAVEKLVSVELNRFAVFFTAHLSRVSSKARHTDRVLTRENDDFFSSIAISFSFKLLRKIIPAGVTAGDGGSLSH